MSKEHQSSQGFLLVELKFALQLFSALLSLPVVVLVFLLLVYIVQGFTTHPEKPETSLNLFLLTQNSEH
jgi:hypothetical protein